MSKSSTTIGPGRIFILCMLAWFVAACGRADSTATPALPAAAISQREPGIPTLPFADNLDPRECGIPTVWGSNEPAWLTGYYEGELTQPIVYLYDSHSRLKVTGKAQTGAEIRIKLFQANPTLNYYLVRTVGIEPAQEGWVPAPFVQFEPPQANQP